METTREMPMDGTTRQRPNKNEAHEEDREIDRYKKK